MKDMALNLIARKIPFAIEKPMGLNAEEAAEILKAAEEAKAFCAIPFVWRYSDTVARLKESILKTKIIHMQYRFIAGPPSRYLASSKWMLSSETAGGGCMTNLGVHFIDMALYLTGSKSADVLSSVYQYGHEYDIEIYASSKISINTDSDVYYPKFAEATLDDFINGRKPRASATEMLVVRKILDRMNEAAKY